MFNLYMDHMIHAYIYYIINNDETISNCTVKHKHFSNWITRIGSFTRDAGC